MQKIFEAIIEKRDKCYIGWIDEVPGAFSQGRTIKEVEENLAEAVLLVLEAERELKSKDLGSKIYRKKIKVQI
jgi:predicted RNase H-like HicB family nuclease